MVELDPVGEALRLGGDPCFGGAEAAIAAVAGHLAPLPVIARAASCGMEGADVRALLAAGVAAVDVGAPPPATGRSRAGACRPRTRSPRRCFFAPGLPVIAAAANGVEAATWLALGAPAASVAGPLDAAAVVHQLRVAVWATGTASADGLAPGHLRAM